MRAGRSRCVERCLQLLFVLAAPPLLFEGQAVLLGEGAAARASDMAPASAKLSLPAVLIATATAIPSEVELASAPLIPRSRLAVSARAPKKGALA